MILATQLYSHAKYGQLGENHVATGYSEFCSPDYLKFHGHSCMQCELKGHIPWATITSADCACAVLALLHFNTQVHFSNVRFRKQ